MATKLNIANQALAHLGQSVRMEDFDEETSTGRSVRPFYGDSKDFVLSDGDWRFAIKKRQDLELVESFQRGGDTIYVWRLPVDFRRRPEVFSQEGDEYRYKVSFDQYVKDGVRVLETCYPDCNLDYVYDLPEALYPPNFGLLQSYKLALLIRNPETLGDGAISSNRLIELYKDLHSKLQEDHTLDHDYRPSLITSTLQAMGQGIGGIPGYRY